MKLAHIRLAYVNSSALPKPIRRSPCLVGAALNKDKSLSDAHLSLVGAALDESKAPFGPLTHEVLNQCRKLAKPGFGFASLACESVTLSSVRRVGSIVVSRSCADPFRLDPEAGNIDLATRRKLRLEQRCLVRIVTRVVRGATLLQTVERGAAERDARPQ